MSLTPGNVALFNRLAAAVVFTEPRTPSSPTPWPPTVWDSRGLWPHAISGDLPDRAGPRRGGRR